MHLHLTVYTTQFHIESTSSLEVHHQPHDSPAWTVQHFYHTYHYQATIVAYYTICIDEKYQFRASLWQIIEVRHAFCVLHMEGSARRPTCLSWDCSCGHHVAAVCFGTWPWVAASLPIDALPKPWNFHGQGSLRDTSGVAAQMVRHVH